MHPISLSETLTITSTHLHGVKFTMPLNARKFRSMIKAINLKAYPSVLSPQRLPQIAYWSSTNRDLNSRVSAFVGFVSICSTAYAYVSIQGIPRVTVFAYVESECNKQDTNIADINARISQIKGNLLNSSNHTTC